MFDGHRTKAIMKREWAAYFNSPVAYVFMIIFLGLMGFFTFSVSNYYEAGQADFRAFFQWHPWLYLILVPAIAMRLWAEEFRSGTVELLLTLPITPTHAIAGKYLAAWLFLLLTLALTFPVVLTARYLGDPDLGPAFCGYLGSALLAGAYLAIGMFTSALTRNQVISFVLAVVLGLFLILAGFPPVTDFLSTFLPEAAVDAVAALGFFTYYDNMQRGLLDLRDVAYFLSVTGLMLFATRVTLQQRTGK